MTDLRQAAKTLQVEVVKLKQMLEQQQAEPVLLECVTCGTVYADGVPPQVPVQQQAEPVADEWAKLLHYPDCWDTAAYPTLHDAVHEALAWSGCSVCKPAQQQAEPVAYVKGTHAGRLIYDTINPAVCLPVGMALYTTPPQRPWVGLTDEDYKGISSGDQVVAMWVERILKERNT